MSSTTTMPSSIMLGNDNGSGSSTAAEVDDVSTITATVGVNNNGNNNGEVAYYNTGFIFFLTMTLLLGITIAIHWSTWIRRNDIIRYANTNHPNSTYYGSKRRHLCNILNILALQICIALFVYTCIQHPIIEIQEKDNMLLYGTTSSHGGGTHGIDNYDDFDDTTSPIYSSVIDGDGYSRIGFFIATITMSIPLTFISSFLCNKYSIRRIILLLSTLFLVIPGCVIITFVCKQLHILNTPLYTYYQGSMRITNITVDTTIFVDQTGMSSSISQYDPVYYYNGAIQISWGDEWGCPTSSSSSSSTKSSPSSASVSASEHTWCDTIVYHRPCSYCQTIKDSNDGRNIQSCQKQGYESGTYDDTKQCVIKEYGLEERLDYDIMDGISKYDILLNQQKTFRHSVKPIDDQDWPNTNDDLYIGNCNTCQVRTTSSYNIQQSYIATLQNLGVLLTCSGVIIHAILMLWQSAIQPITHKLILLFIFSNVDEDDDEEEVNHDNGNDDNNEQNTTDNIATPSSDNIDDPTIVTTTIVIPPAPAVTPSSSPSSSRNEQDRRLFSSEVEIEV